MTRTTLALVTLHFALLGALSALAAPLPQPNEVCFSPDEACDEKLSEFIKSARVSLDVAVFDINLDQVVHQILVQSKKIPVRVLVDRRQSRGKHSLVPLLIKAGAQVRTGYQRGIMHHKFVIVDGRKLMTGSFNFTNGGASKNQENQVYLDTPAVVERFNQRFKRSWGEGLSPNSRTR